MEDYLPKEVDDFDIPESWLVVDSDDEVHVIPDDDIDSFDHELSNVNCFCSPRYVNKDKVLSGEERALYIHNLLTEIRA